MNHASHGYFADRYGFSVVGTVIPERRHRRDADGEAARRPHGGHPRERRQGHLRGDRGEPQARRADRRRDRHRGGRRPARPLAHRAGRRGADVHRHDEVRHAAGSSRPCGSDRRRRHIRVLPRHRRRHRELRRPAGPRRRDHARAARRPGGDRGAQRSRQVDALQGPGRPAAPARRARAPARPRARRPGRPHRLRAPARGDRLELPRHA